MAWTVLPFRGSKLRQGMWFRWSRRHSVLLLPGLSTAHAFEVRWHRWLLGMSALLSQESELQYAGHDIQLIQQTTCAKGTGGLLCMTQLKPHLRFFIYLALSTGGDSARRFRSQICTWATLQKQTSVKEFQVTKSWSTTSSSNRNAVFQPRCFLAILFRSGCEVLNQALYSRSRLKNNTCSHCEGLCTWFHRLRIWFIVIEHIFLIASFHDLHFFRARLKNSLLGNIFAEQLPFADLSSAPCSG